MKATGRSGLRIVLIGEESAAVHTLRAALRTRPHDTVAAVMTSGAGSVSLAGVAAGMGVPVWPARQVKDPAFAARIESEGIDVILNVHSLFIVNERILRAARIGAFNLHPGPLPEYAGLNCVSWALYRGERRFGVTLHWMTKGVDTGDIAYRAAFPIDPGDTPLTLTHKCVRAGAPLISMLLDNAAAGPEAIPRIPQDLSRQERFGKEPPYKGRLSWSRPAAEVANLVRACDYTPFPSPWGSARAMWRDRAIAVMEAARTGRKCDLRPGVVGQCGRSGAFVACADEWLEVRRMKIDGVSFAPREILKPGDTLSDGI